MFQKESAGCLECKVTEKSSYPLEFRTEDSFIQVSRVSLQILLKWLTSKHSRFQCRKENPKEHINQIVSKVFRNRRYDLCYIIRISQANIIELLCGKQSLVINGLDVSQKLCIVPTHGDECYDQKWCWRGTYVMLELANENMLPEMVNS